MITQRAYAGFKTILGDDTLAIPSAVLAIAKENTNYSGQNQNEALLAWANGFVSGDYGSLNDALQAVAEDVGAGTWGSVAAENIAKTSNLLSITSDQSGNIDATLFKNPAGSVYGEFSIASNPSSTEAVVSFSDDTSDERLSVLIRNDGRIQMYVADNGVGQVDIRGGAVSTTEINTFAASWAENQFSLILNGVLIGTDTSGSVPTGVDRVCVSELTGGGASFSGDVSKLRVYPKRQQDSEFIV